MTVVNGTSTDTTAPTCSGGGGGWQAVDVDVPFDPSQLDSDQLAGAFGAGFLVLGTGLVIAWGARFIVTAIRQALP